MFRPVVNINKKSDSKHSIDQNENSQEEIKFQYLHHQFKGDKSSIKKSKQVF